MKLSKILSIENKVVYILFAVLPITLLMGSAPLNLIIVSIDLFFIFIIIKNKSTFTFNKIFFIFIFIWILLMLNSIFIANTFESLLRSFGFVRFIIFIFAFKFFFEKNSNFFKEVIFAFWFFIFLLVNIDIYFEFFTGSNILGFKSEYKGRVASFRNDELNIGNYYFGFILISLSYVYNIFKNYSNSFFYLVTLIFLTTSFIIGERSNFIKVLLMVSFFIFLINNNNYFKKILTIILFGLISYFIISSNNFFNSRFVYEIFQPIKVKGISKYINETKYGNHFELAKKIFKQNKIFGTGIKNFRYESEKIEYHENENSRSGIASHPHQIHYEFLSETGLVGYVIFMLFFTLSIISGFRIFIKDRKNTLALSTALFLLVTFLPLLPSGSFFTSYTASIFWINYSFILINNNFKKII